MTPHIFLADNPTTGVAIEIDLWDGAVRLPDDGTCANILSTGLCWGGSLDAQWLCNECAGAVLDTVMQEIQRLHLARYHGDDYEHDALVVPQGDFRRAVDRCIWLALKGCEVLPGHVMLAALMSGMRLYCNDPNGQTSGVWLRIADVRLEPRQYGPPQWVAVPSQRDPKAHESLITIEVDESTVRQWVLDQRRRKGPVRARWLVRVEATLGLDANQLEHPMLVTDCGAIDAEEVIATSRSTIESLRLLATLAELLSDEGKLPTAAVSERRAAGRAQFGELLDELVRSDVAELCRSLCTECRSAALELRRLIGFGRVAWGTKGCITWCREVSRAARALLRLVEPATARIEAEAAIDARMRAAAATEAAKARTAAV